MLYIELSIVSNECVYKVAISVSHLSVVSALQDAFVVVQFVRYRGSVDFHTSSEHYKFVPLTDNLQEEVHMGPFMHKESDWVFVYNNLKKKKDTLEGYESWLHQAALRYQSDDK